MASLRGTIFTALTGRQADVEGRADGDVQGMLLAVGGASTKTKSGIDLSAAAAKLGVSRRTVERWVKAAQTGTGQRPSPTHAKTLASKARQAATTKAGRRAALADSAVGKAIAARGARLSITALQGPSVPGRDYKRLRTTQLTLDEQSAAAMMDAWQTGGDKGFMAWATTHWGDQYVPDWEFGAVDAIKVEQPFGGEWR